MYSSTGPVQCPADKTCSKWVQRYLRDCVCSVKDDISLVMGLMSMLSWGVAEVPQIITNFKEKSTDGVSVTFLMTWIIGDLFNLAGCYLEKETLPTQLYVALLYTMTTIVLMAQTIYYDHISKAKIRYGATAQPSLEKHQKLQQEKAFARPQTINDKKSVSSASSIGTTQSRQSHYISARFLARSHTPTTASLLADACAFGSEGHDSSFLLPQSYRRSNVVPIPAPRSAPVGKSNAALLRTVASGILLIGGFHLRTTFLPNGQTVTQQTVVAIRGRRILQLFGQTQIGSSMITSEEKFSGTNVPEILGWLMAAIYMSGRLPQIWLNITRETVEGLNPLMFVFALLGNVTYVGSILLRTVDWSRLKPNLPWLVDAGICVLLDLCILLQCLYYYAKLKRSDDDYELLK
ncbi:hypothetical protein O6H91_02G063200 [Diphasiastrum complanatum]|uniref:Uncharacterized protein n=1 Tax=Diphasiastrum complanatum TaxID=34168 RepID=A0ACC2EGG2_DIPCM|nr:hypothetical protein O6H91_02G063200 [Diphasiastrum complanatum]